MSKWITGNWTQTTGITYTLLIGSIHSERGRQNPLSILKFEQLFI